MLVLDEATAALDNATEQAVMDAVDILSRDLTIIMIAHRLSTVQRCDRVIRLEHGKIISDLHLLNHWITNLYSPRVILAKSECFLSFFINVLLFCSIISLGFLWALVLKVCTLCLLKIPDLPIFGIGH